MEYKSSASATMFNKLFAKTRLHFLLIQYPFKDKGGYCMEQKKLEKTLRSIGKTSFVKDFDTFYDENLTENKKINVLAQKYDLDGAIIRVRFAKTLIHYKKEALHFIIDNSPRLGTDIKNEARRLMQQLMS